MAARLVALHLAIHLSFLHTEASGPGLGAPQQGLQPAWAVGCQEQGV